MSQAVSAAANVPSTAASVHVDSRPSSTNALAPALAPAPTPASLSSMSARSQSKDAIESPSSMSFNGATDGRVRNPVPSKLKGMADNRNGNFGVMHMDLTKPETSARDAAAKRTSESTAAAAKLANRNGYQSVKRSQLAWRPSDASAPMAVMSQSQPQLHSSVSSSPHDPNSHSVVPPSSQPITDSPVQQQAGLAPPIAAPHATKADQARLLTLLRSLHPVLVIDRLCNALAYFGGIPGAPPPTDGKFPESAGVNGSGALLVSWLAEIFPHVEGGTGQATFPALPNHIQNPTEGAAANDGTGAAATDLATPPVKRSRGRPKGSKSSKVRKDKGMKKANKALAGTDSAGDSQLTMGVPGIRNGIPQHLSQENQAMTDLQQGADVSMVSTPGSKKRGRPKGSKNRPKVPVDATPTESTPSGPLSTSQLSNLPGVSPLAQKSGLSQMETQSSMDGGFDSAAVQSTNGTAHDSTVFPHTSSSSLSNFALGNPGVEPQANTLPDSSHMTSQQNMYTANRASGNQKRKAGQLPSANDANSMASTSNPLSLNDLHEGGSQARLASPTPNQQAKRRRMSKETGQARGPGALNPQNMSAQPLSPPNPSASFNGSMQSMPGAGNYEPQHPAEGLPAVRTAPRFVGNQRLQRQQQQKTQPQPQQSHSLGNSPHVHPQQSPDLGRVSQSSQSSAQGGMEASGNAQSRQQPPGYYSRSPVNRSPQAYYPHQRQAPNQYGQLGNGGNNFGMNLPNTSASPHFSHNLIARNPSEGGLPHGGHQGHAPVSQMKQPQDGTRRPGFVNQQSSAPSTGPPPNVSQFQGYADGNYLNMDYVMNGQNANNTANAAAAAFGSAGPLEEAINNSNMRGRMY